MIIDFQYFQVKKSSRTLAVGSFLLLGGVVHAQNYVDTVLASGPAAYWRGDAVNEADLVNGFSSTYQGTASVTGAGGGISLTDFPNNRAISFDGTSYVSTGLNSQYQFGSAVTMAGWFNLAQLPSAAGHAFYLFGKSHFGNDLDLQVETDNKVKFYTDSGGHTTYDTALSMNQWYMVAATIDNATHVRSIYIDGNLVASDSGVGNHSADTDTFTIGASLVFNGRNFNGLIDEVSVWDRALDASEISGIYRSTSLSSVPEPCSLAVFGIGGLMAIRRRRAKK